MSITKCFRLNKWIIEVTGNAMINELYRANCFSFADSSVFICSTRLCPAILAVSFLLSSHHVSHCSVWKQNVRAGREGEVERQREGLLGEPWRKYRSLNNCSLRRRLPSSHSQRVGHLAGNKTVATLHTMKKCDTSLGGLKTRIIWKVQVEQTKTMKDEWCKEEK